MKKEIEELKKYHGTYVKVAEELCITPRRLRDVRDGIKAPGKPLEKLAHLLVTILRLEQAGVRILK